MEDLFNILAVGNLNENPILENAILHDVFQERRPRFVRSTKYGKLNFNNLSDEECLLNFRFTKEDLLRLAFALGLPLQIVMENRYTVSSKL